MRAGQTANIKQYFASLNPQPKARVIFVDPPHQKGRIDPLSSSAPTSYIQPPPIDLLPKPFLHIDTELALQSAYQKVLDLAAENLPHIKLTGLGNLGTIDTQSSSGKPTIAVLDQDLQALLITAYGQREYPQAFFILLPLIPQNVYVEGQKIYTQTGITFNWNSSNHLEIGYGKFSEPVEIHAHVNASPLSSEAETILHNNGIPQTNSIFVRKLSNNKLSTQALFKKDGIESPRYQEIDRGRNLTPEQIEALISDFLKRTEATDFVVKPHNKSHGQGVKMFRADALAEAVSFACKSLKDSEILLLEERILSYPLYVNKERMDWNIRVVIPQDDLKDWKIEDSTEVRYKELDGNPVNKSRGAKIMELAEAFEIMGLSPEKREGILNQLCSISNTIREAVYQQLLAENGGKDLVSRAGYSYFQHSLFGIDLIIDEKLNIFCIEINAGKVGGIESLAAIRKDEDKFRAINILTRNIYEAAVRVKEEPTSAQSERANRKYLDSAYHWLALGDLYLHEKKDYQTAAEYYKEGLKYDPEIVEALHNLGHIYNNLGKIDLAIQYYNEALKYDPEFGPSLYDLGTIYLEKGEIDAAFEYYNQALKYDRCATTLNGLAAIHILREDNDHAIGYLKEALKCDPECVATLNNLGESYLRKGEIETAFEYLNQALKYGRDPEVLGKLGLIYLLRNDVGTAFEYINEALKHNPTNTRFLNFLAAAYFQAGETALAIKYFEEVQRLDPSDMASHEALGKLKGMKEQVK